MPSRKRSQNPIGWIDSHCHFDFTQFDTDRDTVWRDCESVGVNRLIIPGVAPEQWVKSTALSERYAGIYYGIGVHPWWGAKFLLDPEALSQLPFLLRRAIRCAKCVAIGECGLDAVIDTPLADQQRLFELHLAAASELHKPLIIHCRKAHNETISALKHHSLPAGGVIHAFSGSLDLAQQYWAMGFYLGIGGTITYERAQKTRNTVKGLPLEAIVLETDAPDMPLAGRQGQRNSPLYIPDIAQVLADIRGTSIQVVAEQTSANACKLFGLK